MKIQKWQLIPWVVVLWAAAIVAQVGLKNWVSPAKAQCSWEWLGLNADGSPCTDLAGFKIGYTTASIDLRIGGIAIKSITLPNPELRDSALNVLLTGAPTGDYRLWVLAYDLAGNESLWSDPAEFSLDSASPGKPKWKLVK